MCFFFSEKNQFPVFGIFVGSGCPADLYRFQNIGLSLGIIPIENIGFRIKIQIQRTVIPIILETDGFYEHIFA